jgi:DNA-binding Lrp family transcriptional regulator
VITAVVLISADRKAIPSLGEALAAIEGVSEVYSVTGQIDFIAMVRAREHEELADIVTGRIGQVPGVMRTDTHVAFKMYSRHDLESLFSIGADQPVKRA